MNIAVLEKKGSFAVVVALAARMVSSPKSPTQELES
jgi:hypothetical protein